LSGFVHLNDFSQIQTEHTNILIAERTYSEPRKWMPGKGRVTIQFGCCYNYAMVYTSRIIPVFTPVTIST